MRFRGWVGIRLVIEIEIVVELFLIVLLQLLWPMRI